MVKHYLVCIVFNEINVASRNWYTASYIKPRYAVAQKVTAEILTAIASVILAKIQVPVAKMQNVK